ncbi:MAG: methyltransferase domain-containing protein [Gemmatimonadaceae bacterium]
MIPRTHFDAAYYRRYYENSETAVVTADMQGNEVGFVIAFCDHIGLTVKRFTDVGAGTGWWAREFAKQYPRCESVETFDASEDACKVYGHRRTAVQNLSGPASDLVVCRDVLRYVPDAHIDRAIKRLATKCRGVLYLHVITSNDEIDEEASDMEGSFRTTSFYRKRLKAAGFRDCGMGLFASSRMKAFDPFSIEYR